MADIKVLQTSEANCENIVAFIMQRKIPTATGPKLVSDINAPVLRRIILFDRQTELPFIGNGNRGRRLNSRQH